MDDKDLRIKALEAYVGFLELKIGTLQQDVERQNESIADFLAIYKDGTEVMRATFLEINKKRLQKIDKNLCNGLTEDE